MTEFEKLCSEYKDNKNLIKEIESMNDTIKAAIIAEMNGKEEMTVGAFKATNKAYTRTDIDKKRLEQEQPDIYKAYVKVTECAPRFQVR